MTEAIQPMFGIQNLPLFIVSGLLLNITPGPDVAYIVTRSATQGLRAGVLAALGIGTGCLVHITAAALGLSALLATSATAFTILKWIGAAYLCHIGWTLWRRAGASVRLWTATGASVGADAPAVRSATVGRVFAQGFLTNALNPKVALFFLAFLPQFIDPAAHNKTAAFLVLGLIFDVNGTVVCLLFAWLAAAAGGFLRRNAAVARWFDRSVGTLFFALGARLALSAAK